MSLEINGVIHSIGEITQITDNFKKREFALKTVDGDYEQHIAFQTTQDRTDILNYVKVGDAVTVKFNLQGKAYTKDGVTRYFNNLNAWRIEKAEAAAPQEVSVVSKATTEEPSNDLPF